MSARHNIREGRKALPLHLIAQAVPMLTRCELAAITERLLERLDELDGDPDLEDDDPAGTDLDKGEDDGANGLTRLLPQPTYANNGFDQTVLIEMHSQGLGRALQLDQIPNRL